MEKVVGLFVGLGQETRLRILEQLADGGTMTPNELADRLGLTQQNVSKHLKTLAQAGIVARTRDGSSALYRMRKPKVLLLDEPCSGLLEDEIEEMERLILGVSDRDAMAIVVIEHRLTLIHAVARRVVVLDEGRIIADEAPAEAFADPAVRAAYFEPAGSSAR